MYNAENYDKCDAIKANVLELYSAGYDYDEDSKLLEKIYSDVDELRKEILNLKKKNIDERSKAYIEGYMNAKREKEEEG